MFLVEPPPSQGDVHFRLLGIPVRIHPFFWVITLLLGLRGESTPPLEVLLWIVAVVISIVIHELGHALVQRRFGGEPRIVLYSLGGLAICEDCDRGTRSQILISLAGPGAGFAFALLLIAGVRMMGQGVGIQLGSAQFVSGPMTNDIGLRLFGGAIFWDRMASPLANSLLFNFLLINILWGLVNLLPIYPLDGGRISRELCQLGDPRGGIILSLQISMIAAIIMAIVGILVWSSIYATIMFGFLAYSSHQTLTAYRQQLW
jgi:stage IV sporulation protein FB